MKKLLKSLLLFTLIIGIFSPNQLNAEDFVLEVPISVEVNGGKIEISGEENLPEITQIQNKGDFILKFVNPQANDKYLYTVYQIDKTDTTLIYDETVYEVRVNFILVDETTVKAEVVVNEENSETKSAEIVFVNVQKVGNVLVVYETEDGETLKDMDYVCKNCVIGKDFTTTQLEFDDYEFVRVEYPDGCEKDDENTVTGKVREDDIIVKYIYRKITPPAPDPKGNVLVVYKAETGEVLKEVEYVCKDCEIGTPYTTHQEAFADYEFVRVENDPEGEVIEGDIIVTYIYRKKPVPPVKKGTLTVIYKTEDGIILKELNSEDEVGAPYTTEKLKFDGYEFGRMDSGSAAVAGEYIDGHLVVIYIYKKPSPIIPTPIRELINTGTGNGALLALGMLFSSLATLLFVRKKKED